MSARMVARCASSGAQKLIARPCSPARAVRPPAGNAITPLTAEMATLCIDGGKKAKMRPGDVLGARRRRQPVEG
jgi:hypothetical protein